MRSLLVLLGSWRTPRDPSLRHLRRQVKRELRAIWAEAGTPAELLFRRSDEFRDRLVALGAAAAPALTATLTGRVKRNSDFVQVTAIQALAELGDGDAAERFVELLDEPGTEELMRKFLLCALVQIDPAVGLPRIRRMMAEDNEGGERSPESTSGAKASAALSKAAGSVPASGREEVFALLIGCLESENATVRGHGVAGLTSLGDARAIPYLAAALLQERNAPRVGGITEGLVALGGRDEVIASWPRLSDAAKEQLLRGLATTSTESRRSFFVLLEHAANEADEAVRRGAAALLADLPDERATQMLLDLFGRGESHRTLGLALTALLERAEADRLLAIWPDLEPWARSHLLQHLQEDPKDDQREQRILLLRRGLADDDPAIAMVAAETIAELDERELLPELRAALPRLQTGHRQLQEERVAAALASLPQMAETHVQTTRDVFGKSLAYDEASFRLLDEIVREGWPEGGPVLANTIEMFAAYLGETVRRVYGGRWQMRDDELVLVGVGDCDIVVRPVALVRHAFERPAGRTYRDAHARLREALRKKEAVEIG